MLSAISLTDTYIQTNAIPHNNLCTVLYSLGGGRILRRTLSVRLSVCLSVRLVIISERHLAPPSELKWHTCTFQHARRAAYRTAISAAQILGFVTIFSLASLHYRQCVRRTHQAKWAVFTGYDSMRKRGLCCRPAVSCLSRWCIVSRRLKISTNFFLVPLAPSL